MFDSKNGKIDRYVSSLESSLMEANNKINDIEARRNFDASFCEELNKKQSEIDKAVKSERELSLNILKDCENLKQETRKLSDEIVDLQSRSMRDNMLFFNVAECANIEDRKNEDCRDKILNFLKNNLGIEDANTRFKIARAHRLGKFVSGKNRPIVANLCYIPDKLEVKQRVYDKREEIDVKVSDQYPKIIQERRKQLIPELIKAREDDKEAVLRYDKLYIDGKLFRFASDQ
ncbi:uncharacterized protein LOC128552288 [Mercenaria mercenaria]|uniref:uncharacterized protein LOC128552288 n=1 Tax=Mercenaria mercenaria TaxID=6596 RepID=UPI00234F93FC|nr:uncharacterized protein LOC128552288 [Mercenaria mercenaria]